MARFIVPNGFLRRGQIAKIFGVGVSLVRYWQQKGKLPYVIDSRTGWWLSPADVVHALAEKEGRLPLQGSKYQQAFALFAAGKLPRDVVQELEGITPERARSLWDIYRLDDPLQAPARRKRGDSDADSDTEGLDEEEQREQEDYDASVDAWTREQAEARAKADAELAREEREHAERRAERQRNHGNPHLKSDASVAGRSAMRAEAPEASTPEASDKLDASDLFAQLLKRLTTT